MVTIPWWFVRYGFPVVALAAVTAIVVFARPTLHAGRAVQPPAATPGVKPAAKKARTKSARATVYSVRSGDTLGVIAERLGTSVDRLMELNPGIDPQALRVGQPIRVA
ncbi:MAG: LysM peptidoglycan-binding domain-containing protein [Actinomycetota bacterium]|nr:LysM peptidoglycan-binding domain-containing protein [Actinomycetota bacterium]